MLTALIAIAASVLPGWHVDARTLAERNAPVFVQEAHRVGHNTTQDLPVAFDFDGDWDMRNSWANQPAATKTAEPTVHYAVVATKERAYVSYYLYYPRDWARFCLPMICHENDLEQFTLIIENDAGDAGRLVAMDAKFHRGYRAYPVAGSGATPNDRTPALLSRTGSGRALLHVDWGGHGITSCDLDGDGVRDEHCVVAAMKSAYVLHPKGGAPVALAGAAAPRGYALVDLHDSLWAHRAALPGGWSGALAYAGSRLGRTGRALGIAFAGSGPGGGARAPWGVRAQPGGAAGDRFFDPALALGSHWHLPGAPDTLPYVEHAYLDDLRGECEAARCDGPTALAVAGEPRKVQ